MECIPPHVQQSLSMIDNLSDAASEREDDSGIESSAPDPQDNTVFIRVGVPELKVQKCLQFQLDDTVWMAKQRVLSSMARELKDGLNYGLYSPPVNGRAGKFLEEERPLRDYPLPGPIGFLEFKYKRRVYKLMQLNPRKLKQLHTKANLKQFMAAVRAHNVDSVSKFTTRGLDPNFQEHDTGDTPLTVATMLDKPRDMLIALISGGYHIDYRSKHGYTGMHRAAQKNNYEAVKTLLDLGASTNYKDSHGLTPLYHSIMANTNAHIAEILLHDHSVIGVADEQGWGEIHQACKAGRVQHLEHLLFYGAEMNAQNSTGNTPLHVCAVNNQESCARVLLFRGADKTIQNFANQDPFQVAVIAGNSELAEVIRHFKPEDVVPFQEAPKYNDKRRPNLTGTIGLHRSRSDPRLNLAGFQGSKPPSPALSNNSLPQYISNGNLSNGNLFEASNAGMLFRSNYDSDSPRSMSISDTGSCSGLSVSSRLSLTSDMSSVSQSRRTSITSATGDMVQSRRSSIGSEALASIKSTLMNKFSYLRRSSISSDGGGQKSLWISDSAKSSASPADKYVRKCSTLPDHRRSLSARPAALPDTYRSSMTFDSRPENVNRRSCSSIPEAAMSYVSNRRRLYAATPGRKFICVKSYRAKEEGELRMRKGTFVEVISVGEGGYWEGKIGDREGWFPAEHVQEVRMRRAPGSRGYGDDDSVLIKRQTLAALTKSEGEYAPRTVVLQKGRSGFGFVLRGAKAQMSQTQALEFTPTADFPALQYLDRVDKASMADRAGLRPGDFLLEINGESVVNATHEHTVRLIKNSGDTLAMKVITVRPMERTGLETRDIHADGTMTLPLKKKDKSELSRPRHRDVDTHSLSQGQGTYHREAPDPIVLPPTVTRKIDSQNKTASIRSRTSASRLTTVELDDLFARQGIEGEPTSPHGRNIPNGNVVVPAQNRPTGRSQQQAQMSRARSQPDLDRGQDTYSKHITRVDINEPSAQSPTPRAQSFDYPNHQFSNGSAQKDNIYATPVIDPAPKSSFRQNGGMHLKMGVIPPPPTERAPEPPSPQGGEVVEITPAYANVSGQIQRREGVRKDESPYESSFRPGKNARLSKTPADLPVNRSRHSSNYSGSGSGSGSSDYSESRQTYSPHKHVMAYEKHSAHSDSGSDKQSVSFAEDRVFENAAKFVQDHPEATVLMTTDNRNGRQSNGSALSDRSRYYEPTPDYDQEETDTVKRRPSYDRQSAPRPESTGSAKVQTEIPPVRSLREQWQKRDGSSPGRSIAAAAAHNANVSERQQQQPAPAKSSVPPPRVTERQSSLTQKTPERPKAKPPAPPTPTPSPAKEEETSMSVFGNAIREAAIAREKRAEEQEAREKERLAEKDARQKREAEEATKREAEKARQQHPPAGVVPPPPAVQPPSPVAQPHARPEFKKSQTPPAQVQKQLEEGRRREQGHNQLMAAIAKRRNYIDNVDKEGSPADDIDSRIERSKSPGRALKDQPNIELVKESTPPKVISPPTPTQSAAGSRRSSLKREAPKPPGHSKPMAPPVPSLESLPREEAKEKTAEEVEADNFTARAERARQEWLKKKQAGTAAAEPSNEPKKTTEDEDNNNVSKDEEDEEKKDSQPPKAPEFVRPSRATPPRDPKPPARTERSVSPSRGGLGDLATIIAQKALQRQKTYEGDIEKEAGGPRGGQVVFGSQRNMNTNLSNGNNALEGQNIVLQKLSQTQPRKSVEITGATVDSSNTEPVTPGSQSTKGSRSVMQRTKMFESQNSPPGYSVKSVTRATNNNNSSSRAPESSPHLPFDLPPPLVMGHNHKSPGASYDRITRKGSDSDVVSNRSSMNGNETVGWVINSNPPQHSGEFAMRQKLANRHGLGGVPGAVDADGGEVAQMALVDHSVPPPVIADIVEVEVIPPPPLFDTDTDVMGGVVMASNFQPAFSHEDNASMVSSLSTLSTLSSNEHDNQFAADSGYQSHIQTQYSSPSSGYHSTSISQSGDFYSELAAPSEFEVAPPPPGFDDNLAGAPMGYADLEPENHYEELSTIQEFIPPPCEFDAVPSGLTRNYQRHSLRRQFEQKNINSWSVNDVADWLDSLELSVHKQAFQRHRVTGQNLTQMGRNELIALGVNKVGDRMNIERGVKRAMSY